MVRNHFIENVDVVCVVSSSVQNNLGVLVILCAPVENIYKRLESKTECLGVPTTFGFQQQLAPKHSDSPQSTKEDLKLIGRALFTKSLVATTLDTMKGIACARKRERKEGKVLQ